MSSECPLGIQVTVQGGSWQCHGRAFLQGGSWSSGHAAATCQGQLAAAAASLKHARRRQELPQPEKCYAMS